MTLTHTYNTLCPRDEDRRIRPHEGHYDSFQLQFVTEGVQLAQGLQFLVKVLQAMARPTVESAAL